VIAVKLACNSVISNGDIEARSIEWENRARGRGESEGSEEGGEEQELRKEGGTGAKIRKLKKCRPALERNRELSMSAWRSLRHHHRSWDGHLTV
jgi:hypothetical protein